MPTPPATSSSQLQSCLLHWSWLRGLAEDVATWICGQMLVSYMGCDSLAPCLQNNNGMMHQLCFPWLFASVSLEFVGFLNSFMATFTLLIGSYNDDAFCVVRYLLTCCPLFCAYVFSLQLDRQ